MCLPGTIEKVSERARTEGVPSFSRRSFLTAAGAAGATASLMPSAAVARKIHVNRAMDLTHTFTAGFPVYTFEEPTRETLVTVEDDGFYAQRWTFGEHSGTHMDAPGHFVSGGRLVPELSPRELLVPVAVIDISKRASKNPDAVVTPDDLVRYEKRHGRIPRNAGVFMYSGWESACQTPRPSRTPMLTRRSTSLVSGSTRSSGFWTAVR